jgi:AraC-like DNA-binding protein
MDHARARLRFGPDQFDDWQDDFCDRHWMVDTRREPQTPFGVAVEVRPVGRARLNHLRVVGGGTSIGRSRQRVAADASIGVALSIVEEGQSALAVNGREHTLSPGDVSLLTGRDVFEKRMFTPEYRERLLVLDHADVVKLAGAPIERRGPAVARRESVAPLLADFIGALSTRESLGGEPAYQAVLKSILVLIADVFQQPQAGALADAGREWQRSRVERFIDEHLGDQDLGPRLIAQKNRISVRYLHKLFEGTGASVNSTILTRRLARCHEDLTSPALVHLRVSEIAFSWGFTSAAHFSRAFKSHYGQSPLETRATAGRSG